MFDEISSSASTPHDIHFTSDDSIVVVGEHVNVTGSSDALFLYLTLYGQIDTRYANGQGYFYYTNPSSEVNGPEVAKSIAVTNDGRIIVVGNSYYATSDYSIVRYELTIWMFDRFGNLDNSFGKNGVTNYRDGENTLTFGGGIAVSQLNSWVVTGFTPEQTSGDYWDALFLRFNPDNRLDQTFGVDGVYRYHASKFDLLYAGDVFFGKNGEWLVLGAQNHIPILWVFGDSGDLENIISLNSLTMNHGYYGGVAVNFSTDTVSIFGNRFENSVNVNAIYGQLLQRYH